MLRALLVDDEKLSLQMLENLIDWETLGVEIVGTAASGEDAAKKCELYRPGLVITDIRMPGMDGLTLLHRIKESAPETEFILVSAYADFEYAREAISLGGAYYLLKPVDELELEKAVHKIAQKINTQQRTIRMIEHTRRQKDMMSLYRFMRTGIGKNAAQKSIDRLQVHLGSFALMGFLLNEGSMNSYIENNVQLDTQLPYLQELLEKKLGEYGALLFDFFDDAWCAIVPQGNTSRAKLAEHMISFFAEQLHMEMHVCFTDYSNGLSTLPDSFRVLRRLQQYSFFMGEDPILGYGFNCKKSEMDQFALTTARRNLEASIHAKDRSGARRILLETMDSQEFRDPDALSFLYEFCYAGIRAVRDHLPEETSQSNRDWVMSLSFQKLQEYATLDDLRAAMLSILSLLHDVPKISTVCSQLVDSGITYLREHYDRNLSLEEICGALGVSRSYFCYLFKKETGQNLWDYLTDIRIAKAKELLKTTEDKTYSIAYQVGYDNPSYFGKLFKKKTGMTPVQYRNSAGR